VTGRYFADSKPKKSAQRSYDEAAAARLWQVSADLVGLTAAAAPLTPGALMFWLLIKDRRKDFSRGEADQGHHLDPDPLVSTQVG
jgi:hypothetical protein